MTISPLPSQTLMISTRFLSPKAASAMASAHLTMAWARSRSTRSKISRVRNGRVTVTGLLASSNLGGLPGDDFFPFLSMIISMLKLTKNIFFFVSTQSIPDASQYFLH